MDRLVSRIVANSMQRTDHMKGKLLLFAAPRLVGEDNGCGGRRGSGDADLVTGAMIFKDAAFAGDASGIIAEDAWRSLARPIREPQKPAVVTRTTDSATPSQYSTVFQELSYSSFASFAVSGGGFVGAGGGSDLFGFLAAAPLDMMLPFGVGGAE
jgi:hypothetical protein